MSNFSHFSLPLWETALFYLGSWLITYAVHSTLILSLAFLLSRLLRNAGGTITELLWKTALLAGVFTAAIQVGSDIEPATGRHQLEVQPQLARDLEFNTTNVPHDQLNSLPGGLPQKSGHHKKVLTVRSSSEYSVRYAATQKDSFQTTFWQTSSSYVSETLDSSHSFAAFLAGQHHIPLKKALVEGPIMHRADRTFDLLFWIKLVVTFWLTGAVLLVLRFMLTRRRFFEQLSDRKPVTDSHIRNALQVLSDRKGRPRNIIITHSACINSPVVLSRKEICLPTRALSELTGEEQKTMLAHEVAHIIRNDSLWLKICAGFDHLLFFQPLNRLARRQIQENAEYLCDEWAIRNTAKSIPLARCLAQVATWVSQQAVPVYHSAMSNKGSLLKYRVERILKPQARKLLPSRLIAGCWILLFSVVVFSAPAIMLKPADLKVYIFEFDSAETISSPQTFTVQSGQKTVRSYRFMFQQSANSPPQINLTATISDSL